MGYFEAGPQPCEGDRAILSLEVFKNMFSCKAVQQVAVILPPPPKISPGCGGSSSFRSLTEFSLKWPKKN